MRKVDSLVSVVLPIRAWSDSLRRYADTVGSILEAAYENYEIILVDYGAREGTLAAFEKAARTSKCLRFLRIGSSRFPDIAILAGIESAIGDYIVTMLPECDPPAELERMVTLARDGAHVVHGIRSPIGPRWGVRRSIGHSCHRILRSLFDVDIPADSSYFRVLSRTAANAMSELKQQNPHICLLSHTFGLPTVRAEYGAHHETCRKSHFSPFWGIRHGISTTMSASKTPLRLAFHLSLFVAGGNLVYIFYVWLVFFLKRDVAEGWVTLSFQGGVMFFFLFLLLALILEYLGRTFEGTKGRPLYHLLDEKSSSTMLVAPDRRNVSNDAHRDGADA